MAREFRGAWVATVANIDWPSRPGLSVWEQQLELIQLLNRAIELRLNAIIFQVRPAADAMYRSSLEPWSEFLTGQMGQAPEPLYDPLAFAVEQAHARGLELHAWFNPYRARHASPISPASTNHISRRRPQLVRQYGRLMWLDPGDDAVQQHSLRVILDVVRRYDVDGVHIDDYFYPYIEREATTNRAIPFPDSATWRRYVRAGGTLDRDDWRRRNVDRFVQRLYGEIKQAKPWVKFGISPFGIWRPGYPAQVRGLDAYQELYADSRKWLANGWVDYFVPQLYWQIGQTQQSYPVLLEWWTQQNARRRHIWPGNFTSRVAGPTEPSWSTAEILDQIALTRAQPGATGNVHFSMRALMQNRGGLADVLGTTAYAEPSLVPASRWLDPTPPARPVVALRTDSLTGGVRLTMRPASKETAWLWVVRAKFGPEWRTEILPGTLRSHALAVNALALPPDAVAVSAVDRVGNESSVVIARRAAERR